MWFGKKKSGTCDAIAWFILLLCYIIVMTVIMPRIIDPLWRGVKYVWKKVFQKKPDASASAAVS